MAKHNQEEINPLTKLPYGEAAGANLSGLNGQVTQESNLTAVDVVEYLREGLIALPEIANNLTFTRLFCALEDKLNQYDNDVRRSRVDLENLTKDKAADVELQKVGHKYSMTMNQTVGYMDMCEQVNIQMQGSGITAVPFWFHDQYLEMQTKITALNEEVASLMATLAKVQGMEKGGLEKVGLELPKRSNIITGNTTVYVPGETGPRMGDEHLDNDNQYMNTKHIGRK